ncbi:S41 family peptidase [Massilia sp. MB5]|uniref:S41 family peptidase n=1 Tax=Massilia sp. MB5 TaxID=2919578 RepID=UPI001F0F5DA8|nr:S41 family peptidase [Massilia sp. MB5]UMR32296.1 S41 family peptidase [Massilia sp. MB5]
MLKKVLLASVFALAALPHAHAADTVNPWSALAQADLDFVQQSIRDNHPGPVDKENAYFKAWLERGYAEASAQAAQARSLGDVQKMLARYIAGFADGHMALSFYHQSRSMRWANMIVLRQGGRYRVAHSGQADVPVNAELLSCDGRAIDAIVKEDLAPAFLNNPELDWIKTELAPLVLLNEEVHPHAEYAACRIAVDGQARSVALQWSDVARNIFYDQLDRVRPMMDKKSSITQVGPKQYWVRLPQFQPKAAEIEELKELTKQMAGLRDAELVVFDTRGNNGGNSAWGNDILAALYGEAYINQLRSRDHGYAEWRVSAGNLEHIRQRILPMLRKQYEETSPAYRVWAGMAQRMQTALEQGQPFLRQRDEDDVLNAPGGQAAPLSKARAALVTKSGCASACLDFADVVLALPDAVHLGETTGADTVYMEVRPLVLPSGLARLVLAQKVYRDRLRAHNAAYVPNLPFDGPIQNDARLKPWVLEQLKAGGGKASK